MCEADIPPKFKVGEIVEQKNLGDLPHFVMEVKRGFVNRYVLEAINDTTYENIPEYMIVPARPPEQSKWGEKCEK